MKSYSELLRELDNLKKGSISAKTINGKKYYYLQYFVNGKIHSEYIKSSELELVREELKRRKEIEELLKEYKKPSSISKRAQSLTGYVMMGDIKVAKFSNGICEYVDDSKAPLFIRRTHNLEEFLRYRTLDLDRPNTRFLLKVLGIDNKDTFISLYSHAATISDNYWFKASGSKLKYNDVCFNNDLYADLALKGEILQLPALGSLTPEITNIGSFEKCWKIIDNEWWMYKAGNEDNIFSELFASSLAKLLNIKTAEYEYDDGYIRTKNFTSKYNFEPMYALMGDNETYDDVFNCLYGLNKDIARDFIKLLVFDLIVYNFDRHNQNYGLMRSKTSGRIISLAPNFDNNLALLAYNKKLNQDPRSDFMIKNFYNFLKKNNEAMNIFKNIEIKDITVQDLDKIYDSIPIKKDYNLISSFIICRIKYIKELQLKS